MAPAYFNRGDLMLRIGRPADALRDCDQAIKLYPELAGAHCTRGLALKALGRLDEAKASFKQNGDISIQTSGTLTLKANKVDISGDTEVKVAGTMVKLN